MKEYYTAMRCQKETQHKNQRVKQWIEVKRDKQHGMCKEISWSWDVDNYLGVRVRDIERENIAAP